jgi:hypothetical protein
MVRADKLIEDIPANSDICGFRPRFSTCSLWLLLNNVISTSTVLRVSIAIRLRGITLTLQLDLRSCHLLGKKGQLGVQPHENRILVFPGKFRFILSRIARQSMTFLVMYIFP